MMIFSPSTNTATGFTLVEVILYIALLVTIVGTILGAFFALTSNYAGSSRMRAVEEEGRYVLQYIEQRTRNAESASNIDSGESANTLTLQFADSSISPMEFSVSDQSLVVTEDGGSEIELTSNHVVVTDAVFENRSPSADHDTIRLKLNLEAAKHTLTTGETYTQTFRGSAHVRDAYE
jgi:Tfp pilus assembly protein PilW